MFRICLHWMRTSLLLVFLSLQFVDFSSSSSPPFTILPVFTIVASLSASAALHERVSVSFAPGAIQIVKDKERRWWICAISPALPDFLVIPPFAASSSAAFAILPSRLAVLLRIREFLRLPYSKFDIFTDNSRTQVSLVVDATTFTADSIPNFQQACRHDNNRLFGKSNGLSGLGRDSVSILSQTTQRYYKVFSHCLPSRSSKAMLDYFSFVPAAPPKVFNIYTPIQTNTDMLYLYFLN
ncbi:hypothetical protein KSP40_PGU017526 [Platanthera guangdongensis]|uniref:Xylanase inhibitor N-terminal domain-containing protein n=1 Tax=Platanthera guangdongensis TaxID=2320717 RepID=A0ABR2M2F8_9ASPA